MRTTPMALGRTVAILLGGTLAVVANAQQPNKLDSDSTPAYQEHNTTTARKRDRRARPGAQDRSRQDISGQGTGAQSAQWTRHGCGGGQHGEKAVGLVCAPLLALVVLRAVAYSSRHGHVEYRDGGASDGCGSG